MLTALILFTSLERFHISYHPVGDFVKNADFSRYCHCSVSALKFYYNCTKMNLVAKIGLVRVENHQIELSTMSQLNSKFHIKIVCRKYWTDRPYSVRWPSGRCSCHLARPAGDKILFLSQQN